MTRKGIRVVVVVAIALLVLVSATVFLINLYRDSIALEVARSALRSSDIRVNDVRVESINSSEVRFDTIILELADGGTVFIEGITLPVRFRGFRDSTLHIETVRVLAGTADVGPIRFAAGLQNFLDAPAATPGATIRIEEVLQPDAARNCLHLRGVRNHHAGRRRYISGIPAHAAAGRYRSRHARIPACA